MVPITIITLSIAFLWSLKVCRSRILFIFSACLLFQMILWRVANIADLALFLNFIYQPILLIISQIIVCYIFNRLGFFKWAAHTIIFTAEGSEIKLLLHILLFSILLSALSNVYAATIIIILMIFDISQSIKLADYKTIKFILLSNLIIEISSLISPSSSLNNLIYMELLGIDYNSFIRKLMLPGFIVVLTLLAFTYVTNRGRLSNFTSNNILNPDTFIKDWKLLNLCFLDVFLIQTSYFLINNRIPLYLIPLILSVILLLYMFKSGEYISESINLKEYLFFILTIIVHCLIIYGLLANKNYFNFKAEFNQFSPNALLLFKTRIFFISAALAGIFGNIPGAFLNVEPLKILKYSLQSGQSLIYISIAGNIIGGKILYLGSLNNIISERMMMQKNLPFTLREYFKIVIPLVILSSLIFILTALLII